MIILFRYCSNISLHLLIVTLIGNLNILVNAQNYTLTHNGHTWDYIIHIPDNLPNDEKVPLVLGLHGYGGAGDVMYSIGFDKTADENGFICVSPTGLPNSYNARSWNGGGFYEYLGPDYDDIGFISALIDTLISKYEIDPLRVYVMGGSNGGFMAYRVAAQLSHKFAAAAPLFGQMIYEYCNPELTVPIIYFHGLSDTNVEYTGNIIAGYQLTHAEDVIETWRQINGCNPDPEIIVDKDGALARKWHSPNNESDVVLYTFEDLAHEWPTVENCGISANETMWEFFSKQKRTQTLNYMNRTSHESDESPNILFYPNPTDSYIELNSVSRDVENLQFSIVDVNGNTLKSGVLANSTINVSCLNNGIYFLLVKADRETLWQKLIVSR